MPSLVPAPLRDATPTRRGLMGVGAQTLAGVKSFLDAIKLALKTTATLPEGGAELEGSMVYDSTTKKAQVHDGTAWRSVVVTATGEEATSLEEHLTDEAAHTAQNISYEGSLTGTDVWAALEELKDTKTESSAFDTLVAEVVDLGSTRVSFTELIGPGGAGLVGASPGGGLSTTTTQGQLNELDIEKMRIDALAATTGTTLVGGAAKAGMTWFQLAAGTLKAQLEELLAHVNNTRLDITAPTDLTLLHGSLNHGGTAGSQSLQYAKDNGSWGHVIGTVTWGGGGTWNGSVATLPAGCRPTRTLEVRMRSFDVTGVGVDGTVDAYLDTGGNVVVNGLSSGYGVRVSFPAFKCQ